MAIRVNRLLSETKIGIATLDTLLKALGYHEETLSINTKIPDSYADVIRALCDNDLDFLALIENTAKKEVASGQLNPDFPLKIVGRIDLDAINKPLGTKSTQSTKGISTDLLADTPIHYSEEESFCLDELMVLSPAKNASCIPLGVFGKAVGLPLYSVLIGINGVGKSTLMKEIVDFFIDLHSFMNETTSKQSLAKVGLLRGIRYHIDGAECEVVRIERSYVAKIDGRICGLKELRLPSVLACHFGTFDKFPTQKVNGSVQTRYDVPYYKYVGAHVNGSMISSSAIAFRLLFALNEQMDERQRQNICSILDFIGYDHRVSLSYTVVLKSLKKGAARDVVSQKVDGDREYSKLNRQKKNEILTELYNFYKAKTSTTKSQHDYEIDFDNYDNTAKGEDLHFIYKLKQYDLVNAANVIFHKNGSDIAPDDMSSGEFAMLSTVLSISAAASDAHTLVLLDEPELSLHPNWQMTLIDNLDRALKDKVCHLLIATHSHMLVSDLPMNRSSVTQIEKDETGRLNANAISECTYGWSAEEVLLKVFKTATDRNRYFGERIGNLLERMGDNTITPEEVKGELDELQEISMHLSDIDPMKAILNTIVDAYK